ncbi:MAG: glycosyltransferase family 2 protein [Gemmatimonadota bacterium]|nr:glycosyltransferase family 2 protein [Gemmatimonadota bacterium]
MIWVALPIHDEQHTAGPLLWRLRQVFGEAGEDYHVLALDDGSTDGTADALEPYTRVMPLTVLRHERRRGFGPSLERLIREAVRRSDYPRRDGLLVMQADFTDAPEAIPELLRRFQGGSDLVIGCPTVCEGAPRAVRAGRRGAGLLTRSLPRLEGIDDLVSGFRLYRLVVLRKALAELAEGEPLVRRDGWAAHLELLAAVTPHVRRSDEVEFTSRYTCRYRRSRFRTLPALWSLFLATRAARRSGAGGTPQAAGGGA